MNPRSVFHAAEKYQPILRELGIDAGNIFTHPLIKPWRQLSDRENCVLDVYLDDGRRIVWHVKRYRAVTSRTPPGAIEVEGQLSLERAGIATAPMVGYGGLPDLRSFVIYDDLTGFSPLDKVIRSASDFDIWLSPTACMAGKLHAAGLHHRDLYLCHFLANPDAVDGDLRLIDAARVKPLPKRFFARRWIVKDLSQFFYSTRAHGVAIWQLDRWLAEYAKARGVKLPATLRAQIDRKADWIARHDAELRRRQPKRNISIPVRPS